MKNPEAATFTFAQEADSCAPQTEANSFLNVEVVDAGCGPYLAIKTDRWALDPEDLPAFIDRLKWCLSVCEQDGKDQPTGGL